MHDAIASWRADHGDYSRLLDVLEEQVAAFHEGRTPDYSLMRDRHHMATEEREILPRCATMLTPDDWRIVGSAAPTAHDPLFGDGFDERYGELRKQIASRSES